MAFGRPSIRDNCYPDILFSNANFKLRHYRTPQSGARTTNEETAPMGVLDDFMVNPDISLLDKTRIQAQVLVP